MILQSRIVSLTDGKIQIPWATSLKKFDSDWDVYLYSIRNHSHSEFVITSFNSRSWRDLWAIRMVNSEGPGILERLGRLMLENRINIISMDSVTTDLSKFHASRIIVDCKDYKSQIDRDYDYRSHKADATLNALKRKLILEFIRELRFFNPNYPSVVIDRVLPLRRLFRESERSKINEVTTKVEKGNIIIPSEEIEKVEKAWLKSYRVSKESIGELFGLISADENLDIIRVFPFYKDFGIVPLSITTENRPGAIATVGKTLKEANFNVIASNAWTSADLDRTSIWMMVQDRGELKNDINTIEQITEKLLSNDQLQMYDPKILR